MEAQIKKSLKKAKHTKISAKKAKAQRKKSAKK